MLYSVDVDKMASWWAGRYWWRVSSHHCCSL